MNRFLTIAVILSAAFLATAANAGSLKCSDRIAGEGQIARVEGSDDVKRYGRNVPQKLAETRAIADWQNQIRDYCPGYSAFWWRANGAHIDCDSGAGHTYCTASGKPARKYLSMFFD